MGLKFSVENFKEIIPSAFISVPYPSAICKLKHKAHKLERKWRSTKVEEFRMAWQDSLKVYRKALHRARKDYYSGLIEENKYKPRILFSTVARLTQNHHSIEPCIPTALTCNDFINFFNDKIILIRENILHLTDPSSAAGNIEAVISPDVCLENFKVNADVSMSGKRRIEWNTGDNQQSIQFV